MAKKHAVVSRYKNPDKFIERLKNKSELYRGYSMKNHQDAMRNKRRISELEDDISKMESKGIPWFTYGEGVELGVIHLSRPTLPHIGQKVKISGEIRLLKKDANGDYGATFILGEVCLLKD